MIERQRCWDRIDDDWSFAECAWAPKSWTRDFRFVLLRRRSLVQRKEPLQLDLFIPRDYEFEYKAIVTNKRCGASAALLFHNGRGTQENLLGEAKSCCALEYIPMRRRAGCHGAGYEIASGAPKLIASGAAKRIAPGAGKRIASEAGMRWPAPWNNRAWTSSPPQALAWGTNGTTEDRHAQTSRAPRYGNAG